MNQLVRIAAPTLPALVTAAGDRAEICVLEVFAGQICNRFAAAVGLRRGCSSALKRA
jgi:hypothetical protein